MASLSRARLLRLMKVTRGIVTGSMVRWGGVMCSADFCGSVFVAPLRPGGPRYRSRLGDPETCPALLEPGSTVELLSDLKDRSLKLVPKASFPRAAANLPTVNTVVDLSQICMPCYPAHAPTTCMLRRLMPASLLSPWYWRALAFGVARPAGRATH